MQQLYIFIKKARLASCWWNVSTFLPIHITEQPTQPKPPKVQIGPMCKHTDTSTSKAPTSLSLKLLLDMTSELETDHLHSLDRINSNKPAIKDSFPNRPSKISHVQLQV